ncbi:hypothetical protein [Cobetia amphilecti]|uniref:hypothetical protein n=1 Tax=Cobetia amphilecti TaxID=1055104 RepID=UPI001C0A2C4C|nr:hypothetical protein [Cobetia amphilecti]MBU3008739.1 hypothetical protein [Cobetia amphilecti]
MEYLMYYYPVMSEQSTDWWAVVIGAAATFGGALLGAMVGATGGYKAALHAGIAIEKRGKLEEIYSCVDKVIHEKGKSYVRFYDVVTQSNNQELMRNFIEDERLGYEPSPLYELQSLCDIYLEDAAEFMNKLEKAREEFYLCAARIETEDLDSNGLEEVKESVMCTRTDFNDAVEQMKNMVRGQLCNTAK